MPTPLPGPTFSFLNHGALLQTFPVSTQNIVLALPNTAAYIAHPAPYLGATIGRTTNRISNAVIPTLNQKSYPLTPNSPPHSLHGGPKGWHSRSFTGPTPLSRNGKESVLFTYHSPDGEEGYPGSLDCRVYYTAHTEPSSTGGPTKTILDIEHEVVFPPPGECNATVVSVTNHSYFNLSPRPAPGTTTTPSGAKRTIAGTELTLGTPYALEATPDGIPTGVISRHAVAPPDLTTPITLGESEPTLDSCFTFTPTPEAIAAIPLDTRPLPLKLAVRLHHPETKLTLEVHTTEPAFQIYTGDALDVPEMSDGVGGVAGGFGKRAGVAVEPGRFVDCAGRMEWRGMCEVRPGGVWGARSRYVGWKEE